MYCKMLFSETGSPQLLIDLRKIPVLVLNMKEDVAKREFMEGQLKKLGYQCEFIEGIRCEPKSLGCALTHFKA